MIQEKLLQNKKNEENKEIRLNIVIKGIENLFKY